MSKKQVKVPAYVHSWKQDEGPKILKALVEGRLMVVAHYAHNREAQASLVVQIGYGEKFVLSGQLLVDTLREYAKERQDLQEAYNAIGVLKRFFTEESEQRLRRDIMERIDGLTIQ